MRFRGQEYGLTVQGFGLRVSGKGAKFRLKVQVFGMRCSDLGFRVTRLLYNCFG